MPKLILLPATGGADDAAVFATALACGRLFDSHLIALHVRPDIQREIATMAAADLGVSAGLDSMIAELEAQSDTREQHATRGWNAFRDANAIAYADTPRHAGITAEWRREVGNLADWIAEHGRTADLIVSGRQREGEIVAMDVLEAALMDSGKPLLIAPDAAPAPLNGTVAIAWKNTRESARAVSAALPFIRRAARVEVVTVQEDADAQADTSPARLLAALRWHAGSVALRSLKRGTGDPVETLLGAVQDAEASLLVMGGYGHTRLREAVFGGFTRAVMDKAPIPVLMAH